MSLADMEANSARMLKHVLEMTLDTNDEATASATARGFLAACVGYLVIHSGPRVTFDILTHLQDSVFPSVCALQQREE